MNVKFQFSKNATSYEEHSIIQRKVIKYLLRKTAGRPRSILDLGCGAGGLYKSVDWQLNNFIAVDFSREMLSLHPSVSGVNCILGDFSDPKLFDCLSQYTIDRIYSASSLQWAVDLNATFISIKKLNRPISFAIFTENTFKAIFSTAGIRSILRSTEEVSALADLYFSACYETVRYTLHFDSSLDMFRYIKASGVSGIRNILVYKEMKKLIRDYPLDYLEFEVLFIIEQSGE